jgi:hypothetical protein
MAPVVHGLEAEYYDRIQFVYLDIDDPQTASFKRSLGFYYQPHLFLLDGGGNIVQQWVGSVTGTELVAGFENVLE